MSTDTSSRDILWLLDQINLECGVVTAAAICASSFHVGKPPTEADAMVATLAAVLRGHRDAMSELAAAANELHEAAGTAVQS